MRTALLFLLALGSTLAFTACDTTSETERAIELLTSSPWAPTDVTAFPGLAERYAFREGDNSGDPGILNLRFTDGSTQETTWALDDEGTVLVLRRLDGGQSNIPIVRLTEDELVLDFGTVEVMFFHVA